MRNALLIALLVALGACTVLPQQPDPVACTLDAKVCPDGSAVGRIPPNCDFAPCPERGKDYCTADDDCVCDGIDTQTGDCFRGNKQYYDLFVNKEQDCPDFCTGIDGRMTTKCVGSKCRAIRMAEPPQVGPTLEVVAIPARGETPLNVQLSATLRGAEHNDKRFYCTALRWDFGDGAVQESTPRCMPYSPDFAVQNRYETEHRYEKPGTYLITFSLGELTSPYAQVNVLPEILPPECDEDSDCAPAQCCHAADCVIKEKRPDCTRTFCTKDCRSGTLDCGGSCGCVNGRCTGKNFQPGTDDFIGPRPWQELPES
jgi:hypothetical protein